MDMNKPGKSISFKATPLPSFYHKRSASPKFDSTMHSQIDITGTDNLGKVPSFKATPLPNFYKKRSVFLKPNSPEKLQKTDEKKVDHVQRSAYKATPLPTFYHKKISLHKPELIKISLPQSSELGNNNMEPTNNVDSGPVSNSAKATTKSLLNGYLKAPDPKSTDSRNRIRKVAYGDEVEKRMTHSIENSDLVNGNA